jgi:hypothetical protein
MSLRYVLVSVALLGGADTLTPTYADSEYVPGPGADNWSSALPTKPKLLGPSLMAQGRDVYRDLIKSRAAVRDREATNLSVALGEARDTLRRLATSWEAAGLRAQLKALRADLRDGSKPPNSDLWSAFVAEIDAAYGVQPPEQIVKAREALLSGREAAGRGDRAAAGHALDAVFSTPGIGDGVLPLDAVRQDVAIAFKAAIRTPTDWDGALKAIDSALTQIQWLRPDK